MPLTSVRTKMFRGVVEKEFQRPLIENGGLIGLLQRLGERPIKSTANKSIALLPLVIDEEGSKATLLVKQYCQSKYNFFLYRWMLLRRRERQFRVLDYCAAQGVSVARQLGVFFVSQGGGHHFVSVYEGLLDCQNLAVLARDEPVKFDAFVRAGGLVRVVALVANMHRQGVVHKDLKWSNLLVGAQGAVHFVDTDHLTKVGRFGARRKTLKDFSRFVVGAYEAKLNETAILQLIQVYGEALADDSESIKAAISARVKTLLLRKGIDCQVF